MQFPSVDGSGWRRKEAIASPTVTRGLVFFSQAMNPIQIALTRLHTTTISMIARLNSSLHCSSLDGVKQYCMGAMMSSPDKSPGLRWPEHVTFQYCALSARDEKSQLDNEKGSPHIQKFVVKVSRFNEDGPTSKKASMRELFAFVADDTSTTSV